MNSDKKVDQLINKYLVISDIHGNLSALEAVLKDCWDETFTGVILLGDHIDYGMRSNEIIQKLLSLENKEWNRKILINIWGNHEKLIFDKDMERLSSDRGRIVADYTAKNLSEESLVYLNCNMNKEGLQKFSLNGTLCLAVHGSLYDPYWKAISPDDLSGDYSSYDIVFSGHSHYSHVFTRFYESDDKNLRNKKAVLFINPGSVGQPRNQNPCAQYAVLSLPHRCVELRSVEYDIEYEQSLFPPEIDTFYKDRLERGI